MSLGYRVAPSREIWLEIPSLPNLAEGHELWTMHCICMIYYRSPPLPHMHLPSHLRAWSRDCDTYASVHALWSSYREKESTTSPTSTAPRPTTTAPPTTDDGQEDEVFVLGFRRRGLGRVYNLDEKERTNPICLSLPES